MMTKFKTFAASASAATAAPLLKGAEMCITASDGGVMIDDGTGTMANVVIADIVADNGVIHVIDRVLLAGTAPSC